MDLEVLDPHHVQLKKVRIAISDDSVVSAVSSERSANMLSLGFLGVLSGLMLVCDYRRCCTLRYTLEFARNFLVSRKLF